MINYKSLVTRHSSLVIRHSSFVVQNSSFRPNWRMRGSSAEVICPNWFDDRLVLGALKLTLLKMLKNSARNWRLILSVTLVTFSNPMSVLKYLGPRRIFFPELPNVPIAFATNLEVSKYRATISP